MIFRMNIILTFICGRTKKKKTTHHFHIQHRHFFSFSLLCCHFCIATSHILVFIVLFCIRQLTCTPVFLSRRSLSLSLYLLLSSIWPSYNMIGIVLTNNLQRNKNVEFEMFQTNSTFHTNTQTHAHTKPIIKRFVVATFCSCLCAAA